MEQNSLTTTATVVGWWRESECKCRVRSSGSVLHNLILQERGEEGRILEEWLYLQPQGKIEGGRWMERKWGMGWDTGA